MAKNPLIRSYPKRINTPQPNKSAGILDDFAVRKNICTKDGTILKTPVDDIDIANKAFVDTLTTNHPHQDVQTTASPEFEKISVDHIGEKTTAHNVVFDNTLVIYDIEAPANTIKIKINNGDDEINFNDILGVAAIYPTTANPLDLGRVIGKFQNLYLSGDAFIDTMTLSSGSITDSTGTISFGNEDLITTGKAGVGTLTPQEKLEVDGKIKFTPSSAYWVKISDNAGAFLIEGDKIATPGYTTSAFRLLPYQDDIYFQNTINSGNIYFSGLYGAQLTGTIYFKADDTSLTGNLLIPYDNKILKIGATNTDLQISSDGTNGIIDVATSLRLGNKVDDYAEISNNGSLIFNGQAGLPFGNIAGDDQTIVCTNQNQWYQVTFNEGGYANLMTLSTANNDMTIIKAGHYDISAHFSAHCQTSQDFEIEIKANNGASSLFHAHMFQTMAVANRVEGSAINTIDVFDVDDTLELWVRCTSSAGKSIVFDHASLKAIQIGGLPVE